MEFKGSLSPLKLTKALVHASYDVIAFSGERWVKVAPMNGFLLCQEIKFYGNHSVNRRRQDSNIGDGIKRSMKFYCD